MVHRIALFGPHGDITNIISQMDVVKFIAQRADLLGPLADAPLSSLGILRTGKGIVAVDPNTPTLAAFAMLASRQLAGAPVVADDGSIIANLSISDLRWDISDCWVCHCSHPGGPLFTCMFSFSCLCAGT